MEKILVTGGSGKLGTALRKSLKTALFPSHKILDITNVKRVEKYLQKNNPSIIIHAAAETDVRKSEKQRHKTWQTNVQGTQNLVKATYKVNPNIYFIFISTACVFYGDKNNYKETDIPSPKNFYSLTKMVGEEVVKNSKLKKYLIIRTNFVSKSRWPYKSAFTDRYGTYLFTEDVAAGIKDLTNAKKTGIIHLTGNKKMSMYELAKKVSPKVGKITLNDYKGPPLTIDMSLDSRRWKKYTISEV